MESGKIDQNEQGIQINTNELTYRGKKYNELRKFSKLKPYNLIKVSQGIYEREPNMSATRD